LIVDGGLAVCRALEKLLLPRCLLGGFRADLGAKISGERIGLAEQVVDL
jgi:hypothetical protein